MHKWFYISLYGALVVISAHLLKKLFSPRSLPLRLEDTIDNLPRYPKTPNCHNTTPLLNTVLYSIVKRLYFDFALDFGFFFLRQSLSFFTNAQSLGL